MIKITEPMMPIIPQINPAFALFPLVPLTFGVTAKQMTAAIPMMIAIGVQQQLDHAYNCYDSKDHCCDRQFHLSAPAVVVSM